MKRCPQCNRFESEEALKFCRIDGATLVNDSTTIGNESGTVQLGSRLDASEVHTSILPNATDANIRRATAPTTVLAGQPLVKTSSLAKPKRRGLVIALIAFVVIVIAIGGYFYFSRKSNASFQSIAVMPFINESGNADVEYLSDGTARAIARFS